MSLDYGGARKRRGVPKEEASARLALKRRGLQLCFEQRAREALDFDSLQRSQLLCRAGKGIDHAESRWLGLSCIARGYLSANFRGSFRASVSCRMVSTGSATGSSRALRKASSTLAATLNPIEIASAVPLRSSSIDSRM
jgi:hypothetical protein